MGKKEFEKAVNKNSEDEEENSSDLEEEDEFGELINDKISSKFLTTLAKLKGNIYIYKIYIF